MPHVRQNNERHSSSGRSSRPIQSSRLNGARARILSLFSGSSTVGSQSSTSKSQKSPRYIFGLPNPSMMRLDVPYLTRSAANPSHSYGQCSHASLQSAVLPDSSITPISHRPIYPDSPRQQLQHPAVSPIRSHTRHDSMPRFLGVDPAERHLAELAQLGRERRRHKRKRGDRKYPLNMKRKIRANILKCFISGMFLTVVLTVYLALALSSKKRSEEFHVLLILVIMVITIFFSHSLIRLCWMLLHPPSDNGPPSTIVTEDFATPELPIRVALARDEEAAGIDSEATKIPPPAYGLWRESVRVDPNRIFWQRNEAATLEHENPLAHHESRPTTASRPPSYVSENGIDCAVEAVGRSPAPTNDAPPPLYPFERGRG